jgi:hypothetical protein
MMMMIAWASVLGWKLQSKQTVARLCINVWLAVASRLRKEADEPQAPKHCPFREK